MDQNAMAPGDSVRALMRRAPETALATTLDREGQVRPYVSLALVAVGHDAAPLLLLSDLADHTRNIARDPRVSLLFDGTGSFEDPLSGPRASVLGRAVKDECPLHLARFLRRHPEARRYAGFQDFNLYRVEVEQAHLVAGFGQIHWLEATKVLYDTTGCEALAAAEAEIVEHMNEDHRDALDLMASHALACGMAQVNDSVMLGIDPEGFDLALGRIDFGRRVEDAETARSELVRMTKETRSTEH